jgi:hypothetical protein
MVEPVSYPSSLVMIYLPIACSHIFLTYSSAKQPVTKESALAKIKEKRARIKEAQAGSEAERHSEAIHNPGTSNRR